MTDPIRQVIEDWRARADDTSIECPDCELVLRRCADELEQALAAGPRPQAAELIEAIRAKLNEIGQSKLRDWTTEQKLDLWHIAIDLLETVVAPPAPPVVIPPHSKDCAVWRGVSAHPESEPLPCDCGVAEAPAVIREAPMEPEGLFDTPEGRNRLTRHLDLAAEIERLRAELQKELGKKDADTIEAQEKLDALKSSLSGVIAEMEKTADDYLRRGGEPYAVCGYRLLEFVATLKRLQGAS